MKNNYILLLLIFTLFSCSEENDNLEEIKKTEEIEEIPEFNINENKLSFELNIMESMPFPDYDFGAEIYNGKIYAFLGSHNYQLYLEKSHGKVCAYDIKNNKWNIINEIPKDQTFATSTIIGDRIYLVGGYGWNNLIQVYNITKNKWEEEIRIPIGLYWNAIQSREENIYIIGGYAEDGANDVQNLNVVQIYNTKTKKWSEGSLIPQKTRILNSLKYKEMFYVWGGYKTNIHNIYNVLDDSWSESKTLNQKLNIDSDIQGLVIQDKLYFISGDKKVYRFFPETEEFQESENTLIKERIYKFKAFPYHNKIYILGGRSPHENWEAMNDVVELKIN